MKTTGGSVGLTTGTGALRFRPLKLPRTGRWRWGINNTQPSPGGQLDHQDLIEQDAAQMAEPMTTTAAGAATPRLVQPPSDSVRVRRPASGCASTSCWPASRARACCNRALLSSVPAIGDTLAALVQCPASNGSASRSRRCHGRLPRPLAALISPCRCIRPLELSPPMFRVRRGAQQILRAAIQRAASKVESA